jgi:hypothetical protein
MHLNKKTQDFKRDEWLEAHMNIAFDTGVMT